jgi:hypothetical protein
MALGTPTIKAVRETADGGQELLMSMAGDGAYAAGGTANFNAFVRTAIKTRNAALGDANVRGGEAVSVVHVVPVTAGVYVPSYDFTNDKLYVYDNSTDAQSVVANMSGTTFEFVAVCK